MGEQLVARTCSCPRCKRTRTLVRLPPNFKCADVICDFCGFLAQVKAASVSNIDVMPKSIMGAAWGPQKDRMDAGVYFPLYLVLVSAAATTTAIYYLSADLQEPEMFLERKALGPNAKRAGWVGFHYITETVRDRFVRLA